MRYHHRALRMSAVLLALVLPGCITTQVEIASPSGEPPADELTAAPADWWERLQPDVALVEEDLHHFWSPRGATALAAGVGAAAALANSDADRSIHHWYRDRVRERGLDDAATAASWIGQLWVVVPIGMETAALCSHAPENYQFDGGAWEWSNRTLRAASIGFPPVVALYGLTGASRPDRDDSRWRPFHDVHGVSGHTFIGAVPFLTAAQMSDSYLLKAPLIAGSFLTGWSRMHDDRHYFSQIALGWWIAYLSVRSVGETQEEHRNCTIGPTVTPDGAGVALQIRY